MVTDVHMEDVTDIICHIYYCYIRQYHREHCQHYVSITSYILHLINIHQQRINSKPFILLHPLLHDISIYTYKQEILTTVMSAYVVYITGPLN